jgi:tartrate dehydrogenase/decarboxylase/D-malate dehydrogenase
VATSIKELNSTYRIALIPGDGIGVDVLEAAWIVLAAAAKRYGFALTPKQFPWSCEYYLNTGSMMPADGLQILRDFDAIFLGAVGWPKKVPDHVSLHGLLLPIRKSFDLYVNERPHKLLKGASGPLKAQAFDILCIRENTEGEYSGAGGRVHIGTPNEVAVETAIFTRKSVEQILRYAFERARTNRTPCLGDEIERAKIYDGVLGRGHRTSRRRLSRCRSQQIPA